MEVILLLFMHADGAYMFMGWGEAPLVMERICLSVGNATGWLPNLMRSVVSDGDLASRE
jgi:hypothetical protein